jgi:hypothetical protein
LLPEIFSILSGSERRKNVHADVRVNKVQWGDLLLDLDRNATGGIEPSHTWTDVTHTYPQKHTHTIFSLQNSKEIIGKDEV